MASGSWTFCLLLRKLLSQALRPCSDTMMKLVHRRKLELLLLIEIFENEDIFYSDLLPIHTIYTMVPNNMLNGKKKRKNGNEWKR
jgi:hypothetical protein